MYTQNVDCDAVRASSDVHTNDVVAFAFHCKCKVSLFIAEQFKT